MGNISRVVWAELKSHFKGGRNENETESPPGRLEQGYESQLMFALKMKQILFVLPKGPRFPSQKTNMQRRCDSYNENGDPKFIPTM